MEFFKKNKFTNRFLLRSGVLKVKEIDWELRDFKRLRVSHASNVFGHKTLWIPIFWPFLEQTSLLHEGAVFCCFWWLYVAFMTFHHQAQHVLSTILVLQQALFPPAKQAGDRVMTFANRRWARRNLRKTWPHPEWMAQKERKTLAFNVKKCEITHGFLQWKREKHLKNRCFFPISFLMMQDRVT